MKIYCHFIYTSFTMHPDTRVWRRSSDSKQFDVAIRAVTSINNQVPVRKLENTMNEASAEPRTLWTWKNRDGQVVQSITVIVPKSQQAKFLKERNVRKDQVLLTETITPTWDIQNQTFVYPGIQHVSLNQAH